MNEDWHKGMVHPRIHLLTKECWCQPKVEDYSEPEQDVLRINGVPMELHEGVDVEEVGAEVDRWFEGN